LFRFNRNIETLCFGIEAKQLKQTFSKQTKTTETHKNNQNFLIKIPKYALYQGVLIALLFVSVRNIETLCFGAEAKQPKQTVCFG
jgi:hypothetical protein